MMVGPELAQSGYIGRPRFSLRMVVMSGTRLMIWGQQVS
jgi:hypothetical protein